MSTEGPIPATRDTRMTVCCMVHREPAMAAAALRLARTVAHEIVVAVDDRLDPSGLRPLLDVADGVHRFGFAPPAERALPWLLSLARGPNVLLLEDDEVPSAALLAELPSVAGDPSLTQAQVAHRWVFPDRTTWLAERPWWPDFRVRHVRIDRPYDVDVFVHGGVRPRQPVRMLTEPLYQLSCVVETFAERRRRARELHAWRRGVVARGGGPLYDILLIPEHFATRAPVPIGGEDYELLSAMLVAPQPEPLAPTVATALPMVSASEVDSYLPAPPDDAMVADARLRVVEADLRTDPGNDTMLAIEVTNVGSHLIPCRDADDVRVRVHTRLIDRRPGAPPPVIGSTALLSEIPPGESRIVEAVVRVPTQPAVHTVEAWLVNERGPTTSPRCRFDLAVMDRFARYVLS
jgi:hypothetical protein